MNDELINFMFKSERNKFQIQELNETTNYFIKSVQSMIEQDRK